VLPLDSRARATVLKRIGITAPILAASIFAGAWLGRVLSPIFSAWLEIDPMLSVSSSTINFGKLPVGDRVTRTITLRNDGRRDLVIREASGTCGCTDVILDKKTLKRGEEARLSVTLTGRPESSSARILIASNDPINSRMFVYLESEAAMPVALVPARVDFDVDTHASLPIEKIIFLNHSDLGMFLNSKDPIIKVNKEYFTVTTKRDIQYNRYEILINLLREVPCGETAQSLTVNDRDGLFSINTDIHVNIKSKFWYDTSKIIATLKYEHISNLSRIKAAELRRRIPRDRFDVKSIDCSESLKDLINAEFENVSDDFVGIFFQMKHRKRVVKDPVEGSVVISAQDRTAGGDVERFAIPVTLVPGPSS
jgi:hypothetical protein